MNSNLSPKGDTVARKCRDPIYCVTLGIAFVRLIAIYCMEKYMATEIGAKGKVVQVLGAVVDVEFPPDQLPQIYNEVKTRIADSERELSLDVEQHLGNNWVRCVA